MTLLRWAAPVAAFVAALLIGRIVVHMYSDHGVLDVFHLVVTVVAATAGGYLAMRALRIHRQRG